MTRNILFWAAESLAFFGAVAGAALLAVALVAIVAGSL